MNSVTVYASRSVDSVFATAVLATALGRKRYRVFIEFPRLEDIRKKSIINSYAIDITHTSGAVLKNTVAITHVPMKRLGLVYKYDVSGKHDVYMKFNNINSTLETSLEYVKTINESIEVPRELLNDIANIKSHNMRGLTRLGKALYYAYRWSIVSDEVLNALYSYAYNVINVKSMKLNEELEKAVRNFEYALTIKDKLIGESKYSLIGNSALVVITDEINDEFIRSNLTYLRCVTDELVTELCRKHKLAHVVYRGMLGYEIKSCVCRDFGMNYPEFIKELPDDIINQVEVVNRGSYMLIRFKDVSNATLDNALRVCNTISSKLPKSS